MREEKVLLDAVVCFLVEEFRILLVMKTDKIGKGCWNGFGFYQKEKALDNQKLPDKEE